MTRSIPTYGLLLAFLAGPLFAGGISIITWVLFAGGPTRAATRIEYVIPLGAAQRIADGEAISSIPAKAVFVVGDILVLRNEDKVKHQIGPFWVPAGAIFNIPLTQASSFNYLCSIHPSGTIGIDVRPQSSLWQTLVPTLLLGVPIGGVLSLILRVAARVEHGVRRYLYLWVGRLTPTYFRDRTNGMDSKSLSIPFVLSRSSRPLA